MKNSPEIDLISLIERDLGPGKRSGRWIIHRCPFPGGHKHGDKNPSLRVTNGDGNRPPWWKCFACGKGGGAVRWLMEYHGMSYQDALQCLKLDKPAPDRPRPEPPIQKPDTPPSDVWQARAWQLIERAESVLWSDRGREVLAWLHARGLRDDAIRSARLGYLPVDFQENPESWGTPNDDREPLYFSRGLLIPGLSASKVWYLKIRPDHPRHGQKYKHTRGGKQALYHAETLTPDKPAVICEGELDAILLTQEAGDLANVVTLAGAESDLNLATWGLYLLRPSRFILALDMDEAGEKGAGKLSWLHNSQRLTIPALKAGDKDITDFHKSGGNLHSLIKNALHPETPIRITWHDGMPLATMRGQYTIKPDDSIEVFYYPEQLEICLDLTR